MQIKIVYYFMVFLKRPAFALLFCAVLASGSATAQRRGEYALRAAATLDSLYAWERPLF